MAKWRRRRPVFVFTRPKLFSFCLHVLRIEAPFSFQTQNWPRYGNECPVFSQFSSRRLSLSLFLYLVFFRAIPRTFSFPPSLPPLQRWYNDLSGEASLGISWLTRRTISLSPFRRKEQVPSLPSSKSKRAPLWTMTCPIYKRSFKVGAQKEKCFFFSASAVRRLRGLSTPYTQPGFLPSSSTSFLNSSSPSLYDLDLC